MQNIKILINGGGMFFWGSPEARLEKKRQSYLNKITHSDHLGRLTVTLLFEGKSLTEILLDKRIEEYLYSEEQFECVMHFIDADANTLLQKKLISQFVFSEQQDPKDLEFIKNKQVRNAILERNRKNLFTCPICTKEHYLPDLKINEPVVMKCGFCNFEIYINKRESGAISKSDNQWLKFQFKMGAIEDQIADIEEQIEDIDDAIDCIENPDEYDSDMYPNIEKYRKLDKETLEAKKEPLLKKKKKLDDKLDPFIDKYYDMKDRYSNRRDRWTTKYEEHSWDEFKEEIRNR